MRRAMRTLTKRDIRLAIFGSLIVVGAFLAVALYAIQLNDGKAPCDQACVAESAEEP
jgi:hypothetical protein